MATPSNINTHRVMNLQSAERGVDSGAIPAAEQLLTKNRAI